MVPGAGIEPARLAAGDFESPASTNFTTRAKGDMSSKLKLEDRYYKAFRKFCFEPPFIPISGLRRITFSRLPRPATLAFQDQGPAQKGSNQDDCRQDADALHGWADRHGADDVGRHQHLKPQKQRADKLHSEAGIAFIPLTLEGGRHKLDEPPQKASGNDQDTHDVAYIANRIDKGLKLHGFLPDQVTSDYFATISN